MKNYLSVFYCFLFLFIIINVDSQAQHSVAREWNDILLDNIRGDFARPTVHARNLFHLSAAMYDAWAVYDSKAEPYLLGNEINGYSFDFQGVAIPTDIESSRNEAISYAAYRILRQRFDNSPEGLLALIRIDQKMNQLGYNPAFSGTDYQNGSPAALGNYIAQEVLSFGLLDNSNEMFDYANTYYFPVNSPLFVEFPGSSGMNNPNRWQQLSLSMQVGQTGVPLPGNVIPFLSPEWGKVAPFALALPDLVIKQRNNQDYWVYHDPSDPPYLESDGSGTSDLYKWGFAMVAVWSSHLDPNDETMIDISPTSIGNIQYYPTNYEDYEEFYDFFKGGDASLGHDINPSTGLPYEPQFIKRSDYARVLAEFWADGPDSETPPGHWFSILNYVSDHPLLDKRYNKQGEVMDNLEWDVKAYLLMGGAMHDCAISAWGIKGFYDYPRPVSVIRYMADKGQSSDSNLPNYHPEGIPLYEGYIELVEASDFLASNPSNINKIKVKAWRGPDYISDPATTYAGVDWILAEEWWPYQRPSFVSPPFAGFVSGHSTYSRAAADILTRITGDEFFPGGLGEFSVTKNEFLVFEEGPTEDFTLQWATYRDASDQTSLSRIWGGIHPPQDDLPGRHIGAKIAVSTYEKAEDIFFVDADEDGYFDFQECNDNDPDINPDAIEICDGQDNNCSGQIDDNIPYYDYYLDYDNDGFGDDAEHILICDTMPPNGYVSNNQDCNDNDGMINPVVTEICDDVDNNCDGMVDNDIPYYTYYQDNDDDGAGNFDVSILICDDLPPAGYVVSSNDCDDLEPLSFPSNLEICDNIDNNCSGSIDDGIPYYDYYLDSDNDGFGNINQKINICLISAPFGYVSDNTDCNDADSNIYPGAKDLPDNGIDEDCSGLEHVEETKFFPNPTSGLIKVHFNTSKPQEKLYLYDRSGQFIKINVIEFYENRATIDLSYMDKGIYYLRLMKADGSTSETGKIIKL